MLAFALCAAVTWMTPQAACAQALSPRELGAALERLKPDDPDAPQLAARVRATFGDNALKNGSAMRVDGLNVAWAVEAPGAQRPPNVVSAQDFSVLQLKRIGTTDLYAGTTQFGDGMAFTWSIDIDGRRIGFNQLETYSIHPDNLPQPGVPIGKVTQMPPFSSKVFPGTTRDWWIYVPAQYTADKPACAMVFQDGAGPKGYAGTVFDNLIAKGDMPVTVGVFISPGTLANGGSNRSFEYDTLSDAYARFLLEEILPEVEKTVKLRHDAASRAITGASSGGICAFTAAWERPNEFSKVLSWVGSFTNIQSGASKREGGHNYAALLRKVDRKPIKVYLQDGSQDIDNEHGSWPLANLEMAASLRFAGYEVKFDYGQGFHSDRHGRAVLPDALRWLWRGYKAE
jgi:enterochelin esterase family protein